MPFIAWTARLAVGIGYLQSLSAIRRIPLGSAGARQRPPVAIRWVSLEGGVTSLLNPPSLLSSPLIHQVGSVSLVGMVVVL